MLNSLLIKDATIITLDRNNRVLEGSVAIKNGRIAAIEHAITARDVSSFDEVIDGRGRILLPGFIQTHIHLCQTLFRGAADDLALIDWLKQRIWPMEAEHTPESLYASARLGIAEMIRGGTTCALTMETVNHTDAVFRAVDESGFRATVGKCMMDQGEDIPDSLNEVCEDSITESLELLERWHGRADGRIRYCFAPRFAVSCTRELLEQVAQLSREHNVMVHTHASENRDEISMVERATGKRNIEYLRDVGLAAPHVVLAHCIWLDENELEILGWTGTHVAHCPSSNLKLSSGFARVAEMLDRGISVSLGADGAPCNNRLDMFTEMRTASLMQKALCGSQTLPALTTLRMATIYGAFALGLADQIGSIEIGKRADIQLLNLNQLHLTPQPDLVSTIVYAAEASDVETVIIDGRIVMRERQLMTLDEQSVIAQARSEANRINRDLGLS
ncbi:MAG: 5'-deoxyadenosine deaminase [Acidobacteria bacterium]|nr:5'-deoxyadenosine deaminase [Acidobacteriota bacterium]MCI0662941.1 5'-deoxyadenosine deaminase [Acidobacteriota bacterium]